jgi:hypothetical protein
MGIDNEEKVSSLFDTKNKNGPISSKLEKGPYGNL